MAERLWPPGRRVSKMAFLFLTASIDRDNEFKDRTIV
jgi:hypothetical protein